MLRLFRPPVRPMLEDRVELSKEGSSFVIQHIAARDRPAFFDSVLVVRPPALYYAAPLRDSRCRATAWGLRAATRRSASVGPSGIRRPCSQLRKVALLTPIMSANSICDALSFHGRASRRLGQR
jgi:hypothetical protein